MKTIEDIEEYLRSKKVSGVFAVRFRKLASAFATLDAFFTASTADIVKMYNRMTPGSKHGIGKKFWPVYNMAMDFYRGRVDEDQAPAPVKSAQTYASGSDDKMMKMHTYCELKSIVDMMEYCNIEAINFMEIAAFLENVRFRQKTADGQNQDAGVLNAK